MHLNLYQIMGIPHDLPQERIPQAFRNKARQVHPDKCKQQDKMGQNKHATILLLEAYRVLNNPAMRKQYDLSLLAQHRQAELNSHRYFQHTNIIEKNGKMYVECEQCMGDTEITQADLFKIVQMEKNSCYIKCWHCGLSLSVDLE